MAINKEKNCPLQVTISKSLMEQIDTIVQGFRQEGVKCTRSDVITASVNLYVKCIVANGIASKIEAEEPQGEKKDA